MTTSYNKAYAKQGSYQQNGFAEGKGYGYANPSDYASKRALSDKVQAVIALAMLAVACGGFAALLYFGQTIKAILF